MSGHSKWSTIKHKKAVTDAKRANVFTKLSKDITIVAREGGGDPEMNFRLRMAMDKAKNLNMPKENIERAIKRGTGELKDGAVIEEIIYEAYGPGQIAMLIKTATDNKNRTLSELKDILNKNGGKFVESGGVIWQFDQVGKLKFNQPKSSKLEKEDLEMIIIDAGAKDYQQVKDGYEVFTFPKELQAVKNKLEEAGVEIAEAELIYLAKNLVTVTKEIKQSYEKLLNVLKENDDVAEIWSNLK